MGISLLNIMCKVLASINQDKARTYTIKSQLGYYQAGFRNGSSTIDQISMMKRVITTCYIGLKLQQLLILSILREEYEEYGGIRYLR